MSHFKTTLVNMLVCTIVTSVVANVVARTHKNSSLDMYKISILLCYKKIFHLSFVTNGHLQLIICYYADF